MIVWQYVCSTRTHYPCVDIAHILEVAMCTMLVGSTHHAGSEIHCCVFHAMIKTQHAHSTLYNQHSPRVCFFRPIVATMLVLVTSCARFHSQWLCNMQHLMQMPDDSRERLRAITSYTGAWCGSVLTLTLSSNGHRALREFALTCRNQRKDATR